MIANASDRGRVVLKDIGQEIIQEAAVAVEAVGVMLDSGKVV